MNAAVDDIQARISEIQRQEAALRVSREASAAQARANTRATFPDLCADADIIESQFGKTAMKYITNGTVTLGKEPAPGMDWFRTTPYRK